MKLREIVSLLLLGSVGTVETYLAQALSNEGRVLRGHIWTGLSVANVLAVLCRSYACLAADHIYEGPQLWLALHPSREV
jgi:hypothetical protein